MIQVFSSYAEDTILYENKTTTGGPAYYIGKSLLKLKVNFNITSGKRPGKVLIWRDREGNDIGKIDEIHSISGEMLGNRDIAAVLVSTISNEFDLSLLEGYYFPLVVVDIQGFLRNRENLQKRILNSLPSMGKIHIIKASKEEFSYLSDSLKQSFLREKNRYVLVTDGKNGVDILNMDGRIHIPTVPGNFKNTIGAGDTFLGVFTYYHSSGEDIVSSVIKAQNEVFNFLMEKSLQYKQ